MSKTLVLAGGGHAHMMILADLGSIVKDGHRVIVIQPSDYHYYSGMGPGMLSTIYTPEDIRFNTRFVVERQGGEFIKAKVESIEAEQNSAVTDDGRSFSYDVLSCNVGSFVPSPEIVGKSDTLFSAKPIERLRQAQEKILSLCRQDKITIGVVGGGPAAVEIAGNCHHLARARGCKTIEVRLFAGKKLMGNFSNAIQNIIRKNFSSRNIIIDESGYVMKIEDNTLHLQNGNSFSPDIIFLATGVKPSPLFSASKIATGPHGGLAVNTFLQSTQYDNIFGGGDCIHYAAAPLDKVGVYAVRQNPVLRHNVRAALNGEQLQEFSPGGSFLLIFNLGEKIGALQKGIFVWGGKSAFFIKDYIDRKFMQKFQTLEK